MYLMHVLFVYMLYTVCMLYMCICLPIVYMVLYTYIRRGCIDGTYVVYMSSVYIVCGLHAMCITGVYVYGVYTEYVCTVCTILHQISPASARR